MSFLKINITELISQDFICIAIHTSLEDTKLAYLLNKYLNTKFEYVDSFIKVKTNYGKSNYNHFVYEDFSNDLIWHLVDNKAIIESETQTLNTLFDAFQSTTYLIPEFKKADFILKIENTDHLFSTENITTAIQNINNVTTAYAIDINKIKYKSNLIF